MFVWLPTGQAIVFATKLCLSSWILSVIVRLLVAIVILSKHLTSVPGRVRTRVDHSVCHRQTSSVKPNPLESSSFFCLLHKNWFEIKCMCTTVYTRRSSSPLLQIGMPGNEAALHSTIFCTCRNSGNSLSKPTLLQLTSSGKRTSPLSLSL